MRWKDKSPPASPYITRKGYQRLEQECKTLWEKRDEVRQALSAAAAEGDRSENAEYIYRKKQLREIDRRITYLQQRMPALKIVATHATDKKVFFSARVELEDENGDSHTFRIVGSDEFDQTDNGVSIDSPLARALLGKQIDDEVQLKTDAGEKNYIIISIAY
ncbi:MAG: transcription elongation factor GreB [Thiotrichales bacterium]|nr:transcription elongation factor GreB [Thiotrichales bacterium]